MAKNTKIFHCTKCDAQFPKWSGRCKECQNWGTIEEDVPEKSQTKQQQTVSKASGKRSRSLKEVAKMNTAKRLKTGDAEVDRVLGGGLVPGSLALFSGEPGIGKSTLAAALAGRVGQKSEKPVLYISGEESGAQLAQRFERLQTPIDNVNFLESYPVETLIATIEDEQPALAVIDSVQTITATEKNSTAGTPSLVRYATSLLLETAKQTGIPILLIGQVTKSGSLAGPKTLEHLVDVVCTLQGDPMHAYRMLRTTKNRFGSTDEIGVFEMREEGLIAVPNPSEQFLAERTNVPGSVITATSEGSRVFLVEVQALVEKSAYATPIRKASGVDKNRLQLLTAILSKQAGFALNDYDVYVNVIGGLTLREPAADLAICAAIVSAIEETSLDPTVYVGEVGLGGEIRSIPLLKRRVKEAARMGIEKAFSPNIKEKDIPDDINTQTLKNVREIKATF